MNKTNRYKDSGIHLNYDIPKYSNGIETQQVFAVTQKSAFLVAEYLLGQPDGACAIIEGDVHWVSPRGKMLDLISSSKSDFKISDGKIENNFNDDFGDRIVYSLSDCSRWTYEHGRTTSILEYYQNISYWLKSPVCYFAEQDMLDKIALASYDGDLRRETEMMIDAMKEELILASCIQRNNTQSVVLF